MHDMRLTTFLIVAAEGELGEQVKQRLHGTGRSLLALDTMTDLNGLADAVHSWKPQVLVADARLQLDPADWNVPVVEYDPLAFDAEATASAILRQVVAPAETPQPAVTRGPTHGVAVGFQGIKGGVGTTTVAAGTAVAARRCGYRAAILDLSGDCALTLRARADEREGKLFLSEEGILVVEGAADLQQVWQILSDEYDVVVVDAGRIGEHVAETRALVRQGVIFFLVVTGREAERLHPASYPGYRLFLNREPDRRWWQMHLPAGAGLVVAGGAPNDPDMTGRVNRGAFGSPSPFLLGMRAFTARVVRREVV